jgi:SNF2 family DNA or RNA helicase
MKPAQRVRIKSAPDKIGVLTDDVQVIGGKKRWLVQFEDGVQRLPEKNLEPVDKIETIESLLLAGSFGSARNLRGAITHARLTGKLADVIYSMESTNTEFYAYQFKSVLNFLSSPSNGILIADEVGLGKTIEAGLI